MSQKRLGIFAVLGSFLILAPIAMQFSSKNEKDVFAAMSTLSDVKETLTSKRKLLQGISEELAQLDPSKKKPRLESAKKHLAYAADVYRLSQRFLKNSRQKHTKYQEYWQKYEAELKQVWSDLEGLEKSFQAEVRSQGLEAQIASKPTVPAPVTASVVAEVRADASSEEREEKSQAPAAPVSASAKKQALLTKYRSAYQAFAKGSPADLDQAKADFRSILESEPSFHLARYWLARTCLLQKDLPEAEVQAKALLKDQPNLQIAKDLIQDVAKARASAAPAEAAVVAQAAPAAAPPIKVLRETRAPISLAAADSAKGKIPVPPVSAVVAAAPIAKATAVEAPPKFAPSKPIAAETRAVAAAKVEAPKALPAKVASVPTPKTPTKPKPAPVQKESSPSLPKGPNFGSDVQFEELPTLASAAKDPKGRAPRPLAIMIENSRHARPQSGLIEADFVYEIPVEGGITRFMAVYENPTRGVDEIGPVRSARPYFVAQAPGIDAIYTHCGGSTQGYQLLKDRAIDHLDEIRHGKGFWRKKSRRAPHNLYTDLEEVWKQSKAKGFRLIKEVDDRVLDVATSSVGSQETRYQDIEIPYYHRYKVQYTYDPISKLYGRYINGEPHMDAAAGRQIAAENVVVVKTTMEKIDDYGRLEVDMVGEGKAFVFRSGEILEARWIRDGDSAAFQLETKSGTKLAMNPGRTWLHVIPENRKVQVRRRDLPSRLKAKLEGSLRAQALPEVAPVPRAPSRPDPRPVAKASEPAPSSYRQGSTRSLPLPRTREDLERRLRATAPSPSRVAPIPAARPIPAPRAMDSSPARDALNAVVARGRSEAPDPVRWSGEVRPSSRPPRVAEALSRARQVLPAPGRAQPSAEDQGFGSYAKAPTRSEPSKAPGTLPPPASLPKAKTWQNSLGEEVDLADFSLDSF